MSKIFPKMGFCASLRDSSTYTRLNQKNFLFFLQTKISSATAPWHGYINDLYRGYCNYKRCGWSTHKEGAIRGISHNQGIIFLANGNSYEGQLVAEKPHGQGIYTWADGAKYEGQFMEGKPHGQGTKTWANGDRYEGLWAIGKVNGQGIYTGANGNRYEGQWVAEKPHGQGICTGADGTKYEGQFMEGKPHGQGTYTWASGDRYEGQSVEGKLHGQGTKTWANGDRYEGHWVSGEPHGQGTYTWASGNRYEGQLEKGNLHGQGTMVWVDGGRYKGQWANSWPEDFIKSYNLFIFKELKYPPIQKEPYLQAIILQSTSDYNDSFGIKEGHCDRLANALAVGGYKTRVIYFSSPKELNTALGTIGEKIDLAWIRAHGSGPAIDCGSRMGNEKTLSHLTPLFNESCSVVFQSCCTGEPKMLAEKYFQILCQSGKSPTVIAPNGLSRFTGIDLDALKNGELKVVMLTTKGALKDIATTYSKKQSPPDI